MLIAFRHFIAKTHRPSIDQRNLFTSKVHLLFICRLQISTVGTIIHDDEFPTAVVNYYMRS